MAWTDAARAASAAVRRAHKKAPSARVISGHRWSSRYKQLAARKFVVYAGKRMPAPGVHAARLIQKMGFNRAWSYARNREAITWNPHWTHVQTELEAINRRAQLSAIGRKK